MLDFLNVETLRLIKVVRVLIWSFMYYIKIKGKRVTLS